MPSACFFFFYIFPREVGHGRQIIRLTNLVVRLSTVWPCKIYAKCLIHKCKALTRFWLPHVGMQVRKKLKHNCSAIQYPIGLETELRGLVDLVHNRAFFFHGIHGWVYQTILHDACLICWLKHFASVLVHGCQPHQMLMACLPLQLMENGSNWVLIAYSESYWSNNLRKQPQIIFTLKDLCNLRLWS